METCDTSRGLTTEQAAKLAEIHGKNVFGVEKNVGFFKRILKTLSEPMFLLLIISSIIYFILGEPKDGCVMLVFVSFVIAIDLLQEARTDKSLAALKSLAAPTATVIRDGKETEIPSHAIVPDDIMLIREGMIIQADGIVTETSSLLVDESTLTGESECVAKTPFVNSDRSAPNSRNHYCYTGTSVIRGSAKVRVTKIGNETEYGKIGKSVSDSREKMSPLQIQFNRLVKTCTVIAALFCIATCILTYFTTDDTEVANKGIQSILSGVTLAMALIPEEFPVVLTVFMSMGAWRISKKNALIRKLSCVETLGEVSVLCTDKTGTLTENKISVEYFWNLKGKDGKTAEYFVYSSENTPYDPMEKAFSEFCENSAELTKNAPVLKSYPFTDETKSVGYARKTENGFRLFIKGSPESITEMCELTKEEKSLIAKKLRAASKKGFRVIAAAYQDFENEKELPQTLTETSANFMGLAMLNDPLRKTVKSEMETLKKAGIRVVMITGDNGFTAVATAKQAGIASDGFLDGNEIEKMTDSELQNAVNKISVFSRVTPEHKKRIIKAFRENGETTAMIGDGVNDAAALKHADIGIAIGKKGNEVSREVADMILLDEKFSTVTETVKDGRRIYDNIKKAVGYIFSIHLPIALSALLSPVFGVPSDCLLLLPVHTVILEILIDPTCSVILERRPAENGIMEREPRSKNEKILTKKLLTKSILQGLGIFLFSFFPYLYLLTENPSCPELARSFGISVIIAANIFSVLENVSETESLFRNIKKIKNDKVILIANIGAFSLLTAALYSPLSEFLCLTALTLPQFLCALLFGMISVCTWEIVKLFEKHR